MGGGQNANFFLGFSAGEKLSEIIVSLKKKNDDKGNQLVIEIAKYEKHMHSASTLNRISKSAFVFG